MKAAAEEGVDDQVGGLRSTQVGGGDPFVDGGDGGDTAG